MHRCAGTVLHLLPEGPCHPGHGLPVARPAPLMACSLSRIHERGTREATAPSVGLAKRVARRVIGSRCLEDVWIVFFFVSEQLKASILRQLTPSTGVAQSRVAAVLE